MQEHTEGERRGKELLGMPVYTVQEGRRLGEVTALLVRREDARVTAVRIGTQLTPGPAVPFGNLRLIGEDAVLVESAATLGEVLPTEVVRGLDDAVRGRPVLTIGGERIGTISSFWVATLDGRITAYRVRPDAGLLSRLTHFLHHDSFDVTAEQVQGLGADALIVSEAVTTIGSTSSEPPPSTFEH